jgi:hypothetical protein
MSERDNVHREYERRVAEDLQRFAVIRPTSKNSLEFLRRLYANVLDWYRIADAKAQLILTLNGIFITIVTGTVFSRPDELAAWRRVFGVETWIFLSLGAVAIVGSIISALLCLHSRLHEAALRDIADHYHVDRKSIETYVPGVAWWFGMIARMEPRLMIHYLQTADEMFEAEALADQIVVLSGRNLAKHRAVNRGWLLAGASLLCLVIAGTSYVLRV